MRPLEIQNHLHTLSLPIDATENDVQKAYRELASICHPDKHNLDPNLKERATAQFANINEARNALVEYFRKGAPEQRGSPSHVYTSNPAPRDNRSGEKRVCQSPIVEFKKVMMDHNVERDSAIGMLIQINLVQSGMKEQDGHIAVFFEFENGKALMGTNRAFCTPNGQATVGQWLAGNLYDSTEWKEYELFMPYDELQLDSGINKSFRFVVAVFIKLADGNFSQLARSGYTAFSFGSNAGTQKDTVMDTSRFNCPECKSEVVSIQALHLHASERTSKTSLRMVFNPSTKGMMPQSYVSQELINPDLHKYTAPPEMPYQKAKSMGCIIGGILIGSLLFPPIFALTIPLCILLGVVNAGGVSDRDHTASMAAYQAQLAEYQKTWVCTRCMKKWTFD